MTDKEFDVLLELSAFSVDESERKALMQDVESILGYVSQLPVASGELQVASGGRPTGDLRSDEVMPPDAKEIEAVRKAFPAMTSDGLLAQDVFEAGPATIKELDNILRMTLTARTALTVLDRINEHDGTSARF